MWTIIKIFDQYPDYRETEQLIAQVREGAKRQALLQEEAAQLYRRLQAAIAAEAWDDALTLVAQIQERVKNYRDIAKLAIMVQQKQREQRRRAWTQRLVHLLRRYAWIGALLLVLSLTALRLVSWAIGIDGDNGGGEPTLAPDPNVPPSNAEAGDTWTRSLDSMVMVYVPPPDVPFVLASGVDAPQEGYWIDKYEVSNAQYRLCVDAGECEPSLYADNERYDRADYPVVGVSWYDAAAYSAWVDGELPIEEEWEYAAVGESGTIFPWGNVPSCELANYWGCVGGTVAVDNYPEGANWVGALNMAGNVWEWTASWYNTDEDRRVVRGGSWDSDRFLARAAARNHYHPDARSLSIGFRVMVHRLPSP